MPGTRERRTVWWLGPGAASLVRAAWILPIVLLAVAIASLTLYCRHLMATVARGEGAGTGEQVLLVGAGGFLLVSGAVVTVQALVVAHRVAGPESRLIQVLRRMRTGDLTMRVDLRRGDLLRDLACECNLLLEWLNRNPPPGAVTGGDVVEVEMEEQVEADEPAGTLELTGP